MGSQRASRCREICWKLARHFFSSLVFLEWQFAEIARKQGSAKDAATVEIDEFDYRHITGLVLKLS